MIDHGLRCKVCVVCFHARLREALSILAELLKSTSCQVKQMELQDIFELKNSGLFLSR